MYIGTRIDRLMNRRESTEAQSLIYDQSATAIWRRENDVLNKLLGIWVLKNKPWLYLDNTPKLILDVMHTKREGRTSKKRKRYVHTLG